MVAKKKVTVENMIVGQNKKFHLELCISAHILTYTTWLYMLEKEIGHMTSIVI